MSVYQLKSQFQDKLRPISDALVRHGVTANQVTIGAIVLSAGTAYIIAHAPENTVSEDSKSTANKPIIWGILPLSLFVRMAMNAIDGMMAREHGQASNLGVFLTCNLLIYIGLGFLKPILVAVLVAICSKK